MELKKQYLNFNEYKVLGGTLDETPFSILEMQAQLIVDKYTFGRLKAKIGRASCRERV